MEYTFASQRQLSFIVSVGGRNRLVAFGSRNQAGVSVFMTNDEKVAHAIRRHSLSRRGIIQETSKLEKPAADAAGVLAAGVVTRNTRPTAKPKETKKTEKPKEQGEKPADNSAGVVAEPAGEAAGTEEEPGGETPGTVGEATGTEEATAKERVYDNYTVARESICKEFDIKKNDVRNPTALARVAKEHGIIIKYKEL